MSDLGQSGARRPICPKCHGKGLIDYLICWVCNGKGRL